MKNLMEELLKAVVDDDRSRVKALLGEEPRLAAATVVSARLYNAKIFHWIYVGDTALHLAAAGYRIEIARTLLKAGADPNAIKNHRKSAPLHYAADGYVSGPCWNADEQVKMIRLLIEAGASVEAPDKNGATALHRAVRTRCATAVRCLLEAGSDPSRQNKPGSTTFHLAVQNTGRGGSGASVAKDAQREIIQEFLLRGLDPDKVKDSKGKSVLESARSSWILDLLREKKRARK